MFVVFEDEQVEGWNQAVGSIARDEVDLLVFEGAREQAEIHDLRGFGEAQAVGGDESFVAVGTLHEFVAKSGAPLRSIGRGLCDGFQVEAAGIFAANLDSEGVVEAKW